MSDEVLICARCTVQYVRPPRLLTSTFAQQPFVCDECRCKDCSIVLHIECECGLRHGEPSSEDPKICIECQEIRKRVANLDPEMLLLRNREIAKQTPIGKLQSTRGIEISDDDDEINDSSQVDLHPQTIQTGEN